MDKENYDWLPHLKDSIPDEAYGDRIDMYVMALEGWRRGLTLKFFNIPSKNKVRFKLSYKNREHSFSVTRGDKVSQEAVQICVEKDLTKKYLDKSGVPVPKGKVFSEEDSDEDVVNSSQQLGFPLVLKPTNGRRGEGVISNIINKEKLIEAISYVRNTLGYQDVILEQYFSGKEYRVYVVNSEVIGVIRRIPANIVGDGIHTIKELISLKNEKRKKVPNLFARLIEIDNEVLNHITDAGYDLNTVLDRDEQLFLRQKGNLSTGGDSIDYTDVISDKVKDIAVKASNAIPELSQCGVDIIFNEDKNEGIVIEVNSRAGVGAHLFPLKGKARDVPKAIMDHYFPETISNDYTNEMYFDFRAVMDMLKNGKAKEIIVQPKPKKPLISKSYNISGKITSNSYVNSLYRKAINLKLSGSLKENGNKELIIELIGNKKDMETFKRYLNYISKKRLTNGNYKIIENEWNQTVKLGFEWNESTKEQISMDESKRLQREIKEQKSKVQKLTQELKQVKKEHDSIINSKSWRYSKPVRKVGKILKKK